jgi:quercetin dioxygenase-like cupin family protein
VIEGRFEAAFGNGPVSVKHTGEGFVEVPHEPRRFRNPDPTRPLRYVIAGSFRKGESLFEPLTAGVSVAPPPRPLSLPIPESPANSSPSASVTEVKRTLLAQHELSDFPGLESRMYLVEFPPAAASKLHIHIAQGVGYVLEGAFESAFGDESATIKRAGDGFIDTPGPPHRFRNPDPRVPLRFVVAGTYHKNEPLLQVVPP